MFITEVTVGVGVILDYIILRHASNVLSPRLYTWVRILGTPLNIMHSSTTAPLSVTSMFKHINELKLNIKGFMKDFMAEQVY